jgi:hypothetical protein
MSSDGSASIVSGRGRQPPPPRAAGPPYGAKPKSKKKKKAVPPQEAINSIWTTFSAPKFSKATTILPPKPTKSTKPKSPAPAEKTNVLVFKDFERAAEECRTRVRKLIRECKRVNMRYRDSEFDIDWDLKWEKGHCLNSLLDRDFEIGGVAYANPASNVPKAVKRVHEIFEKPTFLETVTPADVRQGSLGDCWLMASLTALASMEDGIKRICIEHDMKIGIYGFVFFRDGEWIVSIVDDKLYLKSPDWDSQSLQRSLLELSGGDDIETEYRKTYQTGSQALFFAHCANKNETWLPLLQKAYAKAHGDYGALVGGWNGEGVEDLTGGVTTELLTSDILDVDEFWTNEIMKANKEFLFGCSTGLLGSGYGTRDGISEGHAYVIMEARELTTGERLLKLRNPWGKGKKGVWQGAWSDGSKEFTPEAQIELKHKFGSDSVFWISYPDLLRKYQHFDRTRLFLDSPDWRVTQKWISVDVPWKSEFKHMFQITLKKGSPVVLVLSQLDDRYFTGLQGQYDFRLQFRLHDIDSLEDDDDFIIRSHGNYLMLRSVVAELTDLPAGTYAVSVMVVAMRNPSQPTVEEVIRKQCRRKVENDKLAQVGVSYDFAHSKASAHLETRAAAQKAQDKAKAREIRCATRKEMWEKRHLSREIQRKQAKKDMAKKNKKRRKDLDKANNKVKMKPTDVGVQTDVIDSLPQSMREDKSVQTTELEDLAKTMENEALVKVDEGESLTRIVEELAVSDTQTMNELDKAVQTEALSVSSSNTTQNTPETLGSSPTTVNEQRPFPPGMPGMPRVSIPEPYRHNNQRRNSMPQQQEYRRYYSPPPPPPINYMTSDGESSASPVSDFDDLYSDDEPVLHMNRPQPGPGKAASKSKPVDDDEEDDIEPWNAVAVVGFRVYSQDEELEVRIWEPEFDVLKEEKVDKVKEEIIDEGSEADAEDEGENSDKTQSSKTDGPTTESKTASTDTSQDGETTPVKDAVTTTDTPETFEKSAENESAVSKETPEASHVKVTTNPVGNQ